MRWKYRLRGPAAFRNFITLQRRAPRSAHCQASLPHVPYKLRLRFLRSPCRIPGLRLHLDFTTRRYVCGSCGAALQEAASGRGDSTYCNSAHRCGRGVYNPAGRLRFEAPDLLRTHGGGQDMSRDDCGHSVRTTELARTTTARSVFQLWDSHITSKSLVSSASRPC